MIRTSRIKDHYAEQRMFTRRAIVAAVLVVTLVGVLIGRLTYLQVMRYDYFARHWPGSLWSLRPAILWAFRSVPALNRRMRIADQGLMATLAKAHMS